jgi:hypothetical protein
MSSLKPLKGSRVPWKKVDLYVLLSHGKSFGCSSTSQSLAGRMIRTSVAEPRECLVRVVAAV